MIRELSAHDRGLGGKDGYERREDEAIALLIVSHRQHQLPAV